VASRTINFPPLDGTAPFTEKGLVHPDAHLNLLRVYNGHPLETVDTSGGSADFGVPLAKNNQNVEITFIKTSADVNVPTLVASGSDKINGAIALPMATAQYSKVKLKSDGVSNWYVTG
jgi:hypothetical protein